MVTLRAGALTRLWIRAAGLALCLAAMVGTSYAIRVSRAQVDYFRMKYVREPGPYLEQEAVALNARYPHNYHLTAWAAEMLYTRGLAASGQAREDALEGARILCDQGMVQNPYYMPLPFIKTVLLSRDSLDDAIATWEAFVDWDYWNAEHHAYLVELYAAAGRFGDAARSLRVIDHTPAAPRAQAALQAAFEREARFPGHPVQ